MPASIFAKCAALKCFQVREHLHAAGPVGAATECWSVWCTQCSLEQPLAAATDVHKFASLTAKLERRGEKLRCERARDS